jgi:serine/threonine protein kinase/tetratricopeptide (TPR) repeat protein
MTEEALFQEALSRSPEERAVFLEQACAERPELRAAVLALLAAHAKPDNLLDQAPADLGGKLDTVPGEARDPAPGDHLPETDRSPHPLARTIDHRPHKKPGAVIAGRYTLVETLGEGGMGEVWVAKQSEPVKRRVAIKLIKAGMDSRAVVQRFEHERQALALMDHPNIARVLDGGLTEERRPFFVMELVNGLPLNRFADEARLGIRERLELFMPICQAVQHAHQKGIIHRDLKPSNILVTIIDGKPIPKVIDFGVAKATSGRLTDTSLSTQFGAVVGTLEYMSPEQAGFSGEDIDTRADIYSLGVILYELLTGLRPIDARRLKKAALTEMIRIIKEEEPSKPSTRLSTDASAPSLAALRHTEPRKLMSLLRGELDWVVMKCLEKQRDRRYETANGLARDIQRYLANDPVEARSPSTGYKLKKFVQRNRPAVLAVVAVAMALLAGTTLASWQAVVANQARVELAAKNRDLEAANQAAIRSRNRAGEREDMALKAIDNYRHVVESNPDLLIRSDLKPLRQRLLEAPVGFYRQFKDALVREKSEPSPSPGLDQKLMRANFALAWLNAESGTPIDALKSYQEAVDILEPVAGRTHESDHRRDLAIVYNNLGNIQIDIGRFDDARATHEKAQALRQSLADSMPADAGSLAALSYSEHNLGWLDSKVGRTESALAHYRRAAELREKVLKLDETRVERRAELANTLCNMGWLIGSTGRKNEAREVLSRGVALLEKCVTEQPNVVSFRSDLAQVLRALGELLEGDDARASFAKARALGEAIVAEAPTVPRFRSNLAETMRLSGNSYRDSKAYAEAIVLDEKAVLLGEALARDYPDMIPYKFDLADSLTGLGLTLVDAGRPADALRHHERANEVYKAILLKNPADIRAASMIAGSYNNSALALAALGRHEEAISMLHEAIARERACLERDPKTAQYRDWLSKHYMNLGKSLRALGRKEDALAVSRTRFELLNQAPPEQRDVAIHYHVACEMAQFVPMIGRAKPEADLTDAERAERKQYADRAVEEVRLALADGFSDIPLILKDEDLDPIRSRDDFKKLIAGLEKKSPAKPKKEP